MITERAPVGGTGAPVDLLEPDAVAAVLRTDLRVGLVDDEVRRRRAMWGPNELVRRRRQPLVARVTRHLVEPMSLLLIVAAAISGAALGELVDAAAISAIVLLNSIIALVQEGKASRALEALREMSVPEANVVREGRTTTIPARDAVLGDVIVLHAGSRVPADARVVEVAGLEVDESLLTGESLPVVKSTIALGAAPATISERAGMVFDGTLVTRGSGRAIVTTTGMGTEVGKIAGRLEQRVAPTPLQRQERKLALRLGSITVLIAALVVVVMALRGGSDGFLERAFLVGVALAVAAVPEGLAAVTTLTLALGVKRMAERGGVVRRLPAVETLGSTTVLAIDKTGTLTENRMRVAAVTTADGTPFTIDSAAVRLRETYRDVVALCSDASVDPPSGDPLEVALLDAAGSRAMDLREGVTRVSSLPFDAERKRMTTVHRCGERYVVTMKGAPEVVIPRCGEALQIDGAITDLDPSVAYAAAERLAASGQRVLALATSDLPHLPDVDTVESGLTLVALVALADPARESAPASIAAAHAAGMHVLMVTGDHPSTGLAVARQVGLADDSAHALTGADLRERGIPDDPTTTSVYARVDPDQKLAIVERLQQVGHIVAVTGDGVNDAPALRRADIGVALGLSGTDVAREAADLVITDDDLSTIVAAIREGRGIYANVRKVVHYLLACNLSEVLTVLVVLIAFPEVAIPLLPLQLLWMNLVTDGLPALALGVDPTDPSVMTDPPRPPAQQLVDIHSAMHLALRGAVMALTAVLALVLVRYVAEHPWADARAVMFSVLVWTQLLHAFAARQVSSSPLAHLRPRALVRSVTGNPKLGASVVLGLALQVALVSWAPAGSVFGVAPFAAVEWLIVAVLAVVGALAVSTVPAPRRHGGTR